MPDVERDSGKNESRVTDLFLRAAALEGQSRVAFLDQACGPDPVLRAEVESLLRHDLPTGMLRGAMRTAIPTEAIGPYKILSVLGEGGMGVVYLAEQTEPVHRRVALKVIRVGMDTKQVVARFEAERQALALMDHPSISKVFEAGETPQGGPFFAMEYVEGVPINEYCDRQRLTNHERLELFVQVCTAVQHAHHKAIIHRDLKPSNVLVTMQDGRAVPKVIDFGVAKATSRPLTEKTMFTEQGVMIGTPEYMSPEQAEMTGQDVDTRTDVYSLGVMLYELVVGALPFDSKDLRGAGLAGIVRKICEEDPPKPSARLSTLGDESTESAKRRRVDLRTLRSQLRGDLDWIAMKALEKDRTRRYGSPAELAADVVRHLTDEPVVAGAPSATYRTKKFARRHRVGVGVGFMGIVGLVGFAMTMAVQARRIAAEREAAEKVSGFLADMLGNVDPEDLGIALSKNLRERAAEVQRERGATKERAEATMLLLDETLAGASATGVALRLLDEQILDRAGQSIERRLGQEPRIAARLEQTLGDTYLRLGLYAPAERRVKRAAEIRAQMLGPDHPDTLASMNSLAYLFYTQGRHAEAEKLHRDTLEIRQRVLGKEHKDTLESMFNLAIVYSSQGRFAEAEKLLGDTYEISQRVLGRSHAITHASELGLANVYAGQGRSVEAEKLYRDTLEIRQRALGPDHRGTLGPMLGLANVYFSRGRYVEAEELYRNTLKIQQTVRGPDHPDTFGSMLGLANVYFSRGRYVEAEELYRDLLEMQQKVLGPDHPDTLRSKASLASIWCSQGRFAEAEEFYRDTLEMQQRVMGPDHPDTLASMLGLANLNLSQGLHAEAERLYRETLEIRKRVMGPDHPDTLASMLGLANLNLSQGLHAEAERLYRETLEIRKKVLGPEHPETLASMVGLASAHTSQGRHAEAEKLYWDTLKTYQRVLGPQHPDTFLPMIGLAHVYCNQGRYVEAEKLQRDTLELQQRALGPEHPNTTRSMYSLACLAALRGDRIRALDWLTQAVHHGWKDADQLAKDDDLKPLRGDPAFEALVARARENAKSK